MNVLATPSQRANLGHSGFDMSQLTKFSSTTGELLPVYYDLLYPNDKVSVQVELKTRTMPLDSAAMVSLTEHVDWFAVPLDQLYRFFSQQYYAILDNHSSAFEGSQVIADFPIFNPESFNDALMLSVAADDKYFDGTNIEGKPLFGTANRFLELLDIPINNYNEWDSDTGLDNYRYSCSPFLIAAYQKIYMDYFRLSDRELNNPRCYNLDIGYDDEDFYDSSEIENFLVLRYRPKKRDFFTHLYVSPLFMTNSIGGSASQDILSQFHQWLVPTQFAEGVSDYGTAKTNIYPSGIGAAYSSVTANAIRNALSPQSIKTSFALNKLLEVTRRAGKHIDQQTLAHFGVQPNKFVTGEVRHLAHHSQKVVIGDVISTAETSEAALGQVGGKGYGYGKSKRFTYKNEEACPVILMAIYSAEVDMDYKITGIGRFNTYVTMADFYNPAFDNLGLAPLFAYQSFYNMSNKLADVSWNNTVLGWQFRWMESKIKYNRVAGSLARSLDNWSVWTEYQTSLLNSFLVSPFSLDSIMVTPYQFEGDSFNTLSAYGLNPGTEDYVRSNAFNYDPLIHEFYADVKKSSTMSTFGLEQL